MSGATSSCGAAGRRSSSCSSWASALYVAVASSLASSGTAVLDSRLDQVRSSLTGQAPTRRTPARTGFIFGGGGSGTIALAVDDDDNVLAPRGFHVPPGLPDMDGVASARATGRDVRTTSLTSPGFGPGGGPTTVTTPVRDPDRERRRDRRTDLHGPGHRRPGGRAADARHDAGRARRRRRARRPGRVRLRDHLRAAGARPDPRIAGGPAGRAAPPARVRRRREPRAADAADRHPEQRRLPRTASRRAGRAGRLGARGHRRRGDAT